MERLQTAFPGAKFVKAFNSVGSALMIDPAFPGGARTPARRTATRAGAPTASRSSSSPTARGDDQLWVIDLDGGEARQLTTISTEAAHRHLVAATASGSPSSRRSGPNSPTSRSRRATPLNKKRMEETREEPGQGAGLHAALLPPLGRVRRGQAAAPVRRCLRRRQGGEPHDVTPGDRDAYPTSTTFSVGDDFTFSPDGKYLVFTAVPEKDEAWSTNYDICRVPVDGRQDRGRPDEGQPGGRRRAAVLARRQVAGLPGAEAGRASRPTAGS